MESVCAPSCTLGRRRCSISKGEKKVQAFKFLPERDKITSLYGIWTMHWIKERHSWAHTVSRFKV